MPRRPAPYAIYSSADVLVGVLRRAGHPLTLDELRRAIGGDPADIQATAEDAVRAGRARRLSDGTYTVPSVQQLDREIAATVTKAKVQKTAVKRPRISAALPAATLAQRLASMSTGELMTAARALAKKSDPASDKACTAVLDELEKRAPGEGFDQFVAEIYT